MNNYVPKIFDKLNSTFWKELGTYIAKWVREDMSKGVFQNGKSNLRYLSRQYVNYKRNNMRRFTVGEGKIFTDKAGYFFGKTYFTNKKAKFNKKKGFGTGKRLKAYYGKSISSNETSFVNMELTGKLKKGLRPKKADKFSVTMGFDESDRGKIIGNQRYGRELIGLNDQNIYRVKLRIIRKLGLDLARAFANKKIEIKIGR